MTARFGPALFALVASLPAGRATADAPRAAPAAIEVDRDGSPGGRVSLGFDGGEPVDEWGASAAAGWLDAPIRLAAGALAAGSPATQPVRRRETLALGGALTLGDSVVLDGVLRGSHQVGDRLAAIGDPAGLSRFVFHDLRLGGRIRVAGDRDQAVLLRAELTLPTGNDSQFAGDARWSAAWSLIGRTKLGPLTASATAGFRLRRAEVAVGNRLVGDEAFAAAGIGVPLPQAGPLTALPAPLQLTGALLGALGDRVGSLSGPSPLEARLGLLVPISLDFAISAQAGFGLDDQIGAPRVRALIAASYTPAGSMLISPQHRAPPELDDPDEDSER